VTTKSFGLEKVMAKIHNMELEMLPKHISTTYVDDVLLGFDTVQIHRNMPVFQKNIMFLSSGLEMEIVCFSEMLVSTEKSTWHQNL
jgi:hypothetical protein